MPVRISPIEGAGEFEYKDYVAFVPGTMCVDSGFSYIVTMIRANKTTRGDSCHSSGKRVGSLSLNVTITLVVQR